MISKGAGLSVGDDQGASDEDLGNGVNGGTHKTEKKTRRKMGFYNYCTEDDQKIDLGRGSAAATTHPDLLHRTSLLLVVQRAQGGVAAVMQDRGLDIR